MFVRGSFCIYSAGFCSFFCFFNAGFPDFRLPRAPEQGGAPRLPAEEAATPGTCAPAPANSACAPASSASLGLERMLTEMERQSGGRRAATRKERMEVERPIGRGKVGGGGGVVRNLSRRQGARNGAIVRRNYVYNGLRGGGGGEGRGGEGRGGRVGGGAGERRRGNMNTDGEWGGTGGVNPSSRAMYLPWVRSGLWVSRASFREMVHRDVARNQA